VSEPRSYVSPRRAAAAADTRSAILTAALTSFRTRGYADTSMRAVAAAAGVSERTVYVAFASKAALLGAVVTHDLTDAPGETDAGYESLVDEADLVATMARIARSVTRHHQRTADLVGVVRAAATMDHAAAPLWQSLARRHAEDCSALAHHLAKADLLRPWLGVADAAATLTVLLGQSTFAAHVDELGRTARAYQRWLTSTLTASLLR
jgi:AcrR family transcriptional regulator